AAWRLSCPINELPERFVNNPSLLFDIVLPDKSSSPFRKHATALSQLRNQVAHGFHKRNYIGKVKDFVEAIGTKPFPTKEEDRRQAFVHAVSELAVGIAMHVNDTGGRGNFPVPFLTLELANT